MASGTGSNDLTSTSDGRDATDHLSRTEVGQRYRSDELTEALQATGAAAVLRASTVPLASVTGVVIG